MADHAAHGHDEPLDEGSHAHPTSQVYVRIAIILAIITLVYLVPYANGPEGSAEAAPEAFLRLVTIGERLLTALPF